MKFLCLLPLTVLGAYVWPSQERPTTVEYDRKYMDAIEDTEIFQNLKSEYNPTQDAVYKIDGDFYDRHLVSRWS